MVNTAISDIATRIDQNPGQSSKLTVTVDSDAYPGEFRVPISGTYTKLVSSTAAHKLLRPVVVNFKARLNDDNGEPTIDEVYDIDNEKALAKVPVITDGIVAAKCVNQAATVYPGEEFIASTTAGAVTRRSQEATGATSGTAFRSVTAAVLVRKIVSGDTVGFFKIGQQMGAVY
jgi:hypothetical protein